VTHRERARLDAWVAAERAAGRLRTQTVYGLASAATSALGFAVTSEAAAASWNLAMAADRSHRAPQAAGVHR